MPKAQWKIRPAGFGDAKDIFALVKEHPEELLPRPISDIVQNIDRFLVCEADGNLAGTVSWQILPEIGVPRHPSVELKSLAVAAQYRNSGIGKALVQEAVRRVMEFHPSQIMALTFTPAFFEKMGFRQVPKETLMHKIYLGCINCSKYDSPLTCPEIAMVMETRA